MKSQGLRPSENNMDNLYEISNDGLVNQLSAYSCGIAPTGGHLVCAASKLAALQKYFAWQAGRLPKQTLYGFRFPDSIDKKPYPIKQVIF